MATFNEWFYLVWVGMAILIHQDIVPALTEFMGSAVYDTAGYELTIWHIYTYFVLAYSGYLAGRGLEIWAAVMARSNYTAIIAGLVIVLGMITMIDCLYAYVAGSDELFLVQTLYGLVSEPFLQEKALTVVDVANTTVSQV